MGRRSSKRAEIGLNQGYYERRVMNTKNMFKNINQKAVAIVAAMVLVVAALPTERAAANANYYYVPASYQYQPTTYGNWYGQSGTPMTQAELVTYLKQLIVQLQAQLAAQQGNSYGYGSYYTPGYNYVIGNPHGDSSRNDDDEPDVETDRATSIDSDEARLEGNVDMNDFEDGEVFFVYGEDEGQVEDIEDDYDSYADIDEDGDDLQKVRVDSRFDDEDDFSYRVTGLDDDTDYYFQICVGFEDEDDDDKIICGGVEDFTTDRD